MGASIVSSINTVKNEYRSEEILSRGNIGYGYIAYSGSSGHPEGPCYFDLDDPGMITSLAPTESAYFLTGGTWVGDDRWFGVEYNTGGLWEIDPETGDMDQIGGGGTSCGLSYNPIDERLYSVCGSSLSAIDITKDGRELICSFDGDPDYLIDIAFDIDGTLYGWDSDNLWIIDIETCEGTLVGPLGIDPTFGAYGHFDFYNDILYITTYTGSTGRLYECNEDTGECTLVGNFEGGAEITCLAIPNTYNPHDVEVKEINSPESGYAIENIPMNVTVKNRGNNAETTDVKMQLYKFEEGPVLFEGNFSETFPPDGWTTNFWNQSFTNVAGGESPEAAVYKNWQIEGGQYYDNFIMTPPMDATGYEKVTISFRWAADLNYPQYCSFYISYRKNDTSPWIHVSPWYNPLNKNYAGDLYTINCYGFGGDMGDGFQVRFLYSGYYYYYNYFYLDDVKITAFSNVEEYNETIEDIVLEVGEEKIVDFPTWTPTQWQNPEFENTWQDYIVKAYALLLEDEKPINNYKEKILDLYFPWMHDIELTSIDSPCEDGPGKVFPVQATIKNIGQNAECCIFIDIEIGELIVHDTIFSEDSWDTVPPEGWYDEHKDLDPDYGWVKSNTTYSGGSPHEARLRYSKAKPDFVFYSYAIDTSEYSSYSFKFKSYINHYSGEGLYALEAGYSHDKETWYPTWYEEPKKSGRYEVECVLEGGHETTYIGFWVTGKPYYFNYWCIDDVFVKVLDYVPEYSDTACQSDDLEPGENRTFEFEDWTPDFFEYETTGSRDYVVHSEIYIQGDQNPDNDVKSIYFTLDYWHDPAIEKITSPEGDEGHGWGELFWYNGDPDGRNGLPGSMYNGQSNILIDDFYIDADCYVIGGQFRFVWGDGYGEGNLETVKVYIFEETGDCEPSEDEYIELEVIDFYEDTTGDYYFGLPEIAVDVIFDEVVLPAGQWWIGFQPEGITNDLAYLLTAPSKGCEVMADLPSWGWPRWSTSSYLWGEEYDLAWSLYGWTGGCPSLNSYIQLGTESIEAVAINYGTFEELDITCNAQIWEYITDPYYGIKLFDENITNIDLDEPLGGTYDLEFGDFNFLLEGRYGLLLDMPAPNDDAPKNNKKRWGIGVDGTNPVSSHELCPPNPDGDDGWYVDDVEVILTAYDPVSKDVSSGVAEIKYRINGGPVETLLGYGGTFLLTQEHDGEDVEVEYWAIDNVGNEESPPNRFTIDMDQTDPVVELTYEVTGGNPLVGWTLLFTATASDVTSGIDRVEFFFNGVWQETIVGSGPEFKWSFIYHGGLNIIITVVAYDIAGNMAIDELDQVTCTYNLNNQQQTQSDTSSYVTSKTLQKLLVIPGGYT